MSSAGDKCIKFNFLENYNFTWKCVSVCVCCAPIKCTLHTNVLLSDTIRPLPRGDESILANGFGYKCLDCQWKDCDKSHFLWHSDFSTRNSWHFVEFNLLQWLHANLIIASHAHFTKIQRDEIQFHWKYTWIEPHNWNIEAFDIDEKKHQQWPTSSKYAIDFSAGNRVCYHTLTPCLIRFRLNEFLEKYRAKYSHF